jgi:hypothetical protein
VLTCYYRCWFIHALRCSDSGSREADNVVVSSQLVTSGIYKILCRIGQHAHRLTFQEFASMFASCISSCQGLTSGNATRHICSSLLEPADYRISDASSHVALTYNALAHLRGLLRLRLRSAFRVIAACVSTSAAALSARSVPKSPAAVDIISDTSEAINARQTAAAATDAIGGRSDLVKRQLAFVEHAPLGSASSPPPPIAGLSDECFNDDGSPLEIRDGDELKHNAALQENLEHQLQMELQQIDDSLLHKQLLRSPSKSYPSPNRVFDFATTPAVSPSAPHRASVAPEGTTSMSPLPVASVSINSSSPTFPGLQRPHAADAPVQSRRNLQRGDSRDQSQQQQFEQQRRQQQMSVTHQALIDEAVQAARLQVCVTHDV